MKKAGMCIGVFMVLLLTVGVYTTQAEVTGGMNGTWLKFTGVVKGIEFADGPGSTEAGRNDNDSIKVYGCIVDGLFYDNQFFVQLYEKARTATPAGAAVFQKSAGTANKFAGWFNMNLMEDYNPDTPAIYTTSVSVPGEMTINRGRVDQINFRGFGGQVEKEPAGDYVGYALYGVKKLSAKTATARSLPFSEATACPSGYVIQVKKTTDAIGLHNGIITPAGPWVPVDAGASQQFTITTTVDCTGVAVYLDGETGTPTYYQPCVSPPGEVNFSPVTLSPNANHSIWVVFD
jgi:hypothetical protein